MKQNPGQDDTMLRTNARFLFTFLFSVSIAGCENETCETPFDCDVGESCVEGACVAVEPSDLQILSFNASPSTIIEGESAELSWTTEGADECSINGEDVNCSGVATYSPVTTTTFNLRAETGGQSASRAVIVTVDSVDSGIRDAGTEDAGIGDAGIDDAGIGDAGIDDAGIDDAGVDDAGVDDAGVDDAGVDDAGVDDAGVDDAGVDDAGVGDAGPPDGGRFAEAIAAGNATTCAVLDNGTLKCWGSNSFGQLGLGDTENRGDDETQFQAVNLGAGRRAAAIGVGFSHACAILDNGGAKCWGRNTGGQLGIGDVEPRGDDETDFSTVNLGAGRTAVALAVGYNHNCAILDNGEVKCWGSNAVGQLGIGDTENRGDDETDFITVDLGVGRTAVKIAAGGSHTCVILDDANVKCWGYNEYGQLGGGNTEILGNDETTFPIVDLGSGRTASHVSASEQHVCVILDDGGVKCWGYNRYGQLGVGDIEQRGDNETEFPTVNLGPGRFATEITAGIHHTCAVLDDGSVKCWGRNAFGQLGLGDDENRGDDETDFAPSNLGGIAIKVEAGDHQTCAILESGGVKCWGRNSFGQLGLGDTIDRGANVGDMGDNLPEVQLN